MRCRVGGGRNASVRTESVRQHDRVGPKNGAPSAVAHNKITLYSNPFLDDIHFFCKLHIHVRSKTKVPYITPPPEHIGACLEAYYQV